MPDNGIAVERREAQRPTSLAARTPIAAIPGNGDIAVGAQLIENDRPGGPLARVSDRHMGAVAQLPGASRRSIPLVSRGKENRDAGTPTARKTKPPGGRALAKAPGGGLKLNR